ncbi:MAG: hypothetical protein HQL32_06445 [Planctomycetes bacterium]|nr:hypothetical protein [Planctomycetota bacterium]
MKLFKLFILFSSVFHGIFANEPKVPWNLKPEDVTNYKVFVELLAYKTPGLRRAIDESIQKINELEGSFSESQKSARSNIEVDLDKLIRIAEQKVDIDNIQILKSVKKDFSHPINNSQIKTKINNYNIFLKSSRVNTDNSIAKIHKSLKLRFQIEIKKAYKSQPEFSSWLNNWMKKIIDLDSLQEAKLHPYYKTKNETWDINISKQVIRFKPNNKKWSNFVPFTYKDNTLTVYQGTKWKDVWQTDDMGMSFNLVSVENGRKPKEAKKAKIFQVKKTSK